MVGTVEVEGADELARTLRRAADDFADLDDVNTAAGRYLSTRAAAVAPRRTGRLAGSLRLEASRSTASVSSSVVYANPIHWGWAARNISAQPFLFSTATTHETQLVDFYRREIDRVLSTIHGI